MIFDLVCISKNRKLNKMMVTVVEEERHGKFQNLTSHLSILQFITFVQSFKSNPGLQCFYHTSICDWSGKLSLPAQPIRRRIETNRVSVTQVFPPFGQFACFHFELSLAPCNIFLRSDWRSDNYGCGFMALNRKAFRVAQK